MIEHIKQNTIFIFHCEFSQKRGPKSYQKIREIDRGLNYSYYPELFFPDIYILEKGYSNFHSLFPEWCDGGYTRMDCPIALA